MPISTFIHTHLGFLKDLNEAECTGTVQMLNDVISTYSFTQSCFMALLLFAAENVYCSITLVLSLACVFSIEQDLLVMAQGVFGDCHLYQMYQIVCCTLLYYCVVACFFIPPLWI